MKGDTITVRLDDNLVLILDEVCRRSGRTRSEIIREALKRHLGPTSVRATAPARQALRGSSRVLVPMRMFLSDIVSVFPDTNVLVSAFGTRGLCAGVLRLILGEHELLTGEVVIEELPGVLRRKFGVPIETVNEIESLLRGYHVEPSRATCQI